MNRERAGRRNRKERTRKTAEPVGAVLEALTRDLGIGGKLKQYDVITSWETIVGEQIARVTTVQRFENGVLYVGVATAPWRTELTMKRPEIRKKINAAMGTDIVREIRFR